MVDCNFSTQDFIDIIPEIIPSYQIGAVLNAVQESDSEDFNFDDVGLVITGEKITLGATVLTGAPNSEEGRESLWLAVKGEVYKFFCTNEDCYSDQRKNLSVLLKDVITIIATSVAGMFNVAISVVVGAVTIAVLSLCNIGLNAWCKINPYKEN